MTWWQSLPAIATAVALLLVPGLLFTAALGARGLALAVMAPVASCGLAGAAGILSGLLGVRWNVTLLIVVAIAASGACICLRWATKQKLSSRAEIPRTKLRDGVPFLVALIVPVFLISVWMIRSFPTPGTFVQAYDNVFHLNAIQYIVQTGQASSLTLGHMIQPGSTLAIYPSVWHSLAALIVEVCNVNVFVAENALTLVVAAVLWPFTCIALVRAVIGNKIIAILGAGLLSSSFWVFPFQSIQRGPLLPNLLSYCLLPLVLIALAGLFGLLHTKMMSTFTMSAMLAIGAVALFTSQPNGFTALMVFFIPIFFGALARYRRSMLEQGRHLAAILRPLAVFVPVAVAFSAVWAALVLPYNEWLPVKSLPAAVGDILIGRLTNDSMNWMASLLALLGVLVICARRRGYWMIGAFGLSGVLYVTAAAAPSGPFRNILVGSWYEDTPRLAALVPIFMLLLASIGVHGVAVMLTRAASKVPATFKELPKIQLAHLNGTSVQTVAGAFVLSAMAFFLLDPGYVKLPTTPILTPASAVQKTDGDTWVSADELALMTRITKTVPEGSVIAVNPFNGSPLAYAISGRKVTQYQLSSGPTGNLAVVAKNLSSAAPGTDTCKIASAENIRYILDFGTSYLGDYPAARMYPGFVDVVPSSGVELIDSQGSAKLYKLKDC